MKMRPIQFVEEYSDTTSVRGFTPFRDEKGIWIASRTVVIEALPWDSGSYLLATLNECFWSDGNVQTRKVVDQCVYDGNPYQLIIPTSDQSSLIQALSTGDLRGKYAEDIVRSLYIDLFILNPKSLLREFLSELVKFWEAHYKKYNFSRKSGVKKDE